MPRLTRCAVALIAAGMLAGCSGSGISSSSFTPMTVGRSAVGAIVPQAAVSPDPLGAALSSALVGGSRSRSIATRARGGATSSSNPTPLLFADDFASDTVRSAAAGWTPTGGSWLVCQPPGQPKQYCAEHGGGATMPAQSGQSAWQNYALDASVAETSPAGAFAGVALIGRLVDAHHFYQLELRPDVNGSGHEYWYIWKYSGAWSEIAGGPFATTGGTYRLRLTFSDWAISASVAYGASKAFKLLGGGSDASYASGGIALRCWGTGSAHFGAINVLSTAAAGTPSPTPSATPTAAPTTPPSGTGYDGQPIGTAFFAHNPLARPLSSNPRIDPQSAAMVAAVTVGDVGRLQFTPAGMAGTVVSTGSASDPSYTVRCLEPWGHCTATSVHVPNGTTSGPATDFHNAFIDASNGTETDSWLTCASYQNSGQFGAGYYGSHCTFPLATNSLAIGWGGSGPLSGDGTGFSGTASGLSLVAGIVRPEDLLAGKMTHGVSIAVQCAQRGNNVYPATGSDGQGSTTCTGAGAVPRYGQILWLDAAGENQLLAINPVVLQPYIRAMHDYGFYITDKDEGSNVPAGSDEFATNVEANPTWATVVNAIQQDPQAVDTSVANGSYHISPRVSANIATHLHVLDVSCSTSGC